MIIADGTEPDGIRYRCALAGDDWLVTVKDTKGYAFTETFRVGYPPRCGPDVQDVATAEQIVDKLIRMARGPGEPVAV